MAKQSFQRRADQGIFALVSRRVAVWKVQSSVVRGRVNGPRLNAQIAHVCVRQQKFVRACVRAKLWLMFENL
jgi:hypothetical protein